ncbi:hypothetical protein N7481_011699 [Penicillium waksmanii]|uniref:uncharacterized protein n=1 Tax=Penicillium waksmanii TaxID=69791 RepID=UPI002549955D|nr:uncharacterized protein N7481_011699 [Penicillium waksmanii]KAJ5974489.1 hypothetical protein N7481_011699 [Penicillium waksmanii]
MDKAAKTEITKPLGHIPHGLNLPLGKKSIQVEFRNLYGWNAASEISTQLGHWLTARILYRKEKVKDLANSGATASQLLNLLKWAKKQTETYLHNYPDWQRYLKHIEEHPVQKQGNPIAICAFSTIRDQQYQLRNFNPPSLPLASPEGRSSLRSRVFETSAESSTGSGRRVAPKPSTMSTSSSSSSS